MALNLKKLSPEKRMEIGAELRKKPKKELEEFILNLTPDEREELMYDSYIWLRKKQYNPVNLEKNITLVMAGRGLTY